MPSDDIAIDARDLSKHYFLYARPQDRLKQSIVPRLQRLAGRAPARYYRDFAALSGVSFQVRRGETVGIIGRNGSGKSTLLQIVCGTLQPSGGTVEVNGRVAALLELGAGFNTDYTGRENVYLNAAILGLSRSEIDQRFDAIAAFADIGAFIDQPVKTYSSGMYVRLAFATAINVDPDILVVDEALSVGDIRFQSKCVRRIQEIRGNGASILLVSHAGGVVEALCDRVVWLEQGCVRRIGAPKDVVRRYTSFMNHGVEDTANDVTPPHAPVPAQTATDADWRWLDTSLARNVRARPNCSIPRFRIDVNGVANPSTIECAPCEMTFECEVVTDQRVAMPLVGFGLFNALDEPVIHFNSDSLESAFRPIEPGRAHIIRVRASLPALKPGQYLVGLGLDDGPHQAHDLVCHVHDAWVLNVAMPRNGRVQAGYIQTAAADIGVRDE